MSKITSLFRTTLQSNFDSPRAKKKRSEGKSTSAAASGKSKVGRLIFPLLIGAALLYGLYYLATRIYDPLEAFGRQDIFVDFIFLGVAITMAGFGFMFFMQEMYYSQDIPVYMYLPIKKRQILTFRFAKVLFLGLIMVVVSLLPFLVAYGVKSSVGLAYIPYAFLTLLFMPIIPLTVVGLISMLLMRFTTGLKTKKAVSIVTFVGGAIGVQFILQTLFQSFNPAFASWLTELDGMFDVVYTIFPGLEFAAKALTLTGTSALVNLGYFIAASTAAFGLFLLAGKVLYFKGLVGIGEETSKRKAISKDELKTRTAASSKSVAYIGKEIRQIRRSLPALFNCIINPVLLFPGIASYSLLSIASNDMEMLVENAPGGVLVGAIVGVSLLFSVMNPVFASVVSREGSNFHFMKFIPMSMESQLKSKMSVGFVLGVIPCLLIGTAAAVAGIPIGYVIAGVLCSLIIIAALAMTGAIIDLQRPKLNWSDESRVLSMSLNFVLHALIGIGYVAIAILPIVLSALFGWDSPVGEFAVSSVVYIGYVVVVFGAVNLLLYRWTKRNARRLIMSAS